MVSDVVLANLAWATIAIPFITGITLLLMSLFEIKGDKKYSEKFTGSLGVAGLAGSWIVSLVVLVQFFKEKVTHKSTIGHVNQEFDFLPSVSGSFKWGILLDPLSVVFLVLLTTIATVIHFYASEYMTQDPAYTRFFGTMNFFTGSMLGFVLASNLFMAFIFWELLGFSSYLLIGFYWQKRSAASAAKKAFLYNKIGDISFLIGIAIIWNKTLEATGSATLSYLDLAEMMEHGDLRFNDFIVPALLIFGGAIGKSAQFPLFGWLPEAMEGPTPVSALLHSSTMVKAGLFLIARNYYLFYVHADGKPIINLSDGKLSGVIAEFGLNSNSFNAANAIVWIGVITALAGGLMALTATDIKKVLAFSTISQLGYIALAMGAGGLTAGMFHLISHATFKSLLFLCAGAVIHSVHSNEMTKMGGLKRYMPYTYWTMLIGLLGLSGVPLMNGFWSKDAVLLALQTNEEIVLGEVAYVIAVLTAGLTAFYSTKLFLLVFHGEPRYDKDHVHPTKTGMRMRISLVILASLVVIESLWWTIGTIIDTDGSRNDYWNFEYALGTLFHSHGGEFKVSAAIFPTVVGLIGISFAYAVYGNKRLDWMRTRPLVISAEKVITNRFGVDQAILWVAETPVMGIGDFFQKIDVEVIDAFIIDSLITNGSHRLADMSDTFDNEWIDGTVDKTGIQIRQGGYLFRRIQRGQTSYYARIMTGSLATILVVFTFVRFV